MTRSGSSRFSPGKGVVFSRGPALRIGFHDYNIPEDVDAVLRARDRRPELLTRR
jgi:hypothetical protein